MHAYAVPTAKTASFPLDGGYVLDATNIVCTCAEALVLSADVCWFNKTTPVCEADYDVS